MCGGFSLSISCHQDIREGFSSFVHGADVQEPEKSVSDDLLVMGFAYLGVGTLSDDLVE